MAPGRTGCCGTSCSRFTDRRSRLSHLKPRACRCRLAVLATASLLIPAIRNVPTRMTIPTRTLPALKQVISASEESPRALIGLTTSDISAPRSSEAGYCRNCLPSALPYRSRIPRPRRTAPRPRVRRRFVASTPARSRIGPSLDQYFATTGPPNLKSRPSVTTE
jgi:hypothetical protein